MVKPYDDSNGATLMNSLITGSATGAAVQMRGLALTGVAVPASMAGTSLTFEVSLDGVNYMPLKDSTGNTITLTITSAAAWFSMGTTLPFGIPFIRPVSSATETTKTLVFIGQRVM